MAMDITVSHFEGVIGHDGSQIVFPELPEPQCRRGYHISEAVWVANCCGYSATPFELYPQIGPSSGSSPPIAVEYPYGNQFLATALLMNFRGVCEARTPSGNWHAVAFNRGKIYDPDPGREPFEYSRQACEARGLYTTRVWQIRRWLNTTAH
jgi:hypothetical protein